MFESILEKSICSLSYRIEYHMCVYTSQKKERKHIIRHSSCFYLHNRHIFTYRLLKNKSWN